MVVFGAMAVSLRWQCLWVERSSARGEAPLFLVMLPMQGSDRRDRGDGVYPTAMLVRGLVPRHLRLVFVRYLPTLPRPMKDQISPGGSCTGADMLGWDLVGLASLPSGPEAKICSPQATNIHRS